MECMRASQFLSCSWFGESCWSCFCRTGMPVNKSLTSMRLPLALLSSVWRPNGGRCRILTCDSSNTSLLQERQSFSRDVIETQLIAASEAKNVPLQPCTPRTKAFEVSVKFQNWPISFHHRWQNPTVHSTKSAILSEFGSRYAVAVVFDSDLESRIIH